MKSRRLFATVLCTILAARGTAASAQTADAGTQLDVGVGLGHGGGGGDGVRDDRRGTVLSAVLTQTVNSSARRALHLGVSVRRFDVHDAGDDCQGALGACFARYPALRSVGVVAGVRLAGGAERGPSLRLLGGPAYVWTDESRSIGIDGRVDLAFTPRRAVGLVMYLESAVVPSLNARSYWTGAIGVGVRWQR